MQLFDVHAHHPAKSASEGVFACFSGFSPQTNAEVIEYARTHENCVFSLGLAPQDVIRTEKPEDLLGDLRQTALNALSDPILSKKFAAIGECGLDYHWGKTEEERAVQRRIFTQVIEFALSIGKPLVIHSRDAESDCIKMLHDAGCNKAMMHCFGGNLEEAVLAESYGYLISIPPLPSKERKKIIKSLKLQSLVAETDAPYIGKICADAGKSVEMVAKYREITIEEALASTYADASSFFNLG